MERARTRWFKGRLALYALLLAALLALVVGVGLTFLDNDLSGGEVASSIGLNLVASVLFAVIFSYVSGNIQERLLLERIEGTISGVSQDLLGKLAGYETHYMPVATYEAGDRWVDAYNDDVTDSFERTVAYAFRGTSAKYVPARLERVPRGSLRYVDIIMLDPRSDGVLEARAAIKGDQTNDSRNVSELARDIKDEVLMSVVALFDCRRFCEPKISFVRDVAATRVELFDDAVYISWYQGPDSAKKPFPESIKFAEGTFAYKVQTQELHGRIGLAAYHIEIKRGTGEDELIGHLKELAGRDVTPVDVQEWRDRHARTIADFERFLDQRRGA